MITAGIAHRMKTGIVSLLRLPASRRELPNIIPSSRNAVQRHLASVRTTVPRNENSSALLASQQEQHFSREISNGRSSWPAPNRLCLFGSRRDCPWARCGRRLGEHRCAVAHAHSPRCWRAPRGAGASLSRSYVFAPQRGQDLPGILNALPRFFRGEESWPAPGAVHSAPNTPPRRGEPRRVRKGHG